MNAHLRSAILGAAGFLASLTFVSTSTAVVMSVDFGPASGEPGIAAPGFTRVSTVGMSTVGSYMVNIGGNPENAFFDTRATLNLNNTDPLLRDFLFNNSQDPLGGIELDVIGLSPSTAYNFTGFSYQDTQQVLLNVTARGGTTGSSFSITNDGTDGGTLTAASPLVRGSSSFTTDATGTLSLQVTGLAGTPLDFGPRMNGFVVSQGATDLVSVDFGPPPPSSPVVAPGFTLVNSTGATTIGPYTLTVGGNPGNSFFDTRATLNLNNADPLLRDFLFNNDQAANGGIDLMIEGLDPNRSYKFTGFSYQDTQAVSTQINAGPGSTGAQVTISNDGTDNGTLTASSPLVSGTGIFTTDGAGVLRLAITGLAGTPLDFGPRFNGFILDTVGVPGDYNGNNAVDAADYVVWRKGGPLQNEVAGVTPGSVTEEDYAAWRARFGSTSGGSGLSPSAVPEPTSALLLASMGIAVVGASARRPRKGRKHLRC